MKKINVIFLAVIMMMACINKVNANDIYVEENGAGGAYTSIAIACQAAQSGDRILVVPRANNAFYNEITGGNYINLPANCKMVSAVSGKRFRVTGDFIWFEMNHKCQLSQAEFYIQAGISGADSILVSNCLLDSGYNIYSSPLIAGSNGVHFDNDSVFTIVNNNGFMLNSGRISGCYSSGGVNYQNPSNTISDTIFLVGNWIAGVIYINGGNFTEYFYVANNYLGGGFVANNGLRNGATGMSTIINNIFTDLQSSIYDGITINGANNTTTRLNIKNNLFINPFTYFHTPTAVVYNTGNLSSDSRISYNYVNFNNSSSNYTFAYGFTPDTTNHFTSNTDRKS